MGGLAPPIQSNQYRRLRLWMAGSSPAMARLLGDKQSYVGFSSENNSASSS